MASLVTDRIINNNGNFARQIDVLYIMRILNEILIYTWCILSLKKIPLCTYMEYLFKTNVKRFVFECENLQRHVLTISRKIFLLIRIKAMVIFQGKQSNTIERILREFHHHFYSHYAHESYVCQPILFSLYIRHNQIKFNQMLYQIDSNSILNFKIMQKNFYMAINFLSYSKEHFMHTLGKQK